jgi:hypothetical protein
MQKSVLGLGIVHKEEKGKLKEQRRGELSKSEKVIQITRTAVEQRCEKKKSNKDKSKKVVNGVTLDLMEFFGLLRLCENASPNSSCYLQHQTISYCFTVQV